MVVYRINLFDWRTEYYQKKEKNFYILGVFSLVLAFFLFGMLYFFSQSKIDQQLARNQKIDEQIKTLDKKMLAINQIKAKHEALLKQLQSIAKIKKNKYLLVYLLDEITRNTPPGVYLSQLIQNGESVEISGVAESENLITSLIQNFRLTHYIKEPNLIIKNQFTAQNGNIINNPNTYQSFKITMKLIQE